MSLELCVHTSWEYDSRSIMICGFREPTGSFTGSLDEVMEHVTVRMITTLNRYELSSVSIRWTLKRHLSISEPYFYTSTSQINRIVPVLLRHCLDDHDYYIAAVWNGTDVTEIYILSNDAGSDEMETMETLSQSFVQD